ncbi:GH3 auxin-responsive promoter [Cinnamomum micranthum f. kanehirae]|uniref:GH3 auxin-responsive promoter n=1 Tax=Cinnamomum micranthum f. kanehirae TaxID=337451 RepID=A0A3S3MIJ8_9MAGN|nr:GH3 auxin-responsive promoter [Cinnamomum micranthum f. kanehirae]
MGASFATCFLRVIRFLEKNWTSLCNDIRTGTLDARITDHLVRAAVMKILKPDPELAEFVENECSRDSWEGIINRLWPNTKYLQVIMTGTMSQYTPRVNYYSNGLPLASTIYASSECFSGINLNPLCKPSEVSYTLIPTLAYFEFLPVHRNDGVARCNKEKQDLVDLVDVELGQEYELVVTTYAGLYRYRVGDVLRVAGFKNKAPQFNFIRRENVILSIDVDKTNEMELQDAVNNAIKHLEHFGASLIEYTSNADTSSIPGHYVLYWELCIGATPIPPWVFEDCCVDVYREGRAFDK